MFEPDLIITLKDRTSRGAIKGRHLEIIKQHLLSGGLVLLPSDTCYSLASIATNKFIYKTINSILNREDDPISLAFPNFLAAEEFAKLDFYTCALMENFTPGPITIICKISTEDPGIHEKLQGIVRTTDGTIGIRIPDSFIEKEVAGCTKFPITTPAVRYDNKDKDIVQNFADALEIVSKGIVKLKSPIKLIAIEGDGFSEKHSTVVKVEGRIVKLIREGQIDFNLIKQAMNNFPISNISDWT